MGAVRTTRLDYGVEIDPPGGWSINTELCEELLKDSGVTWVPCGNYGDHKRIFLVIADAGSKVEPGEWRVVSSDPSMIAAWNAMLDSAANRIGVKLDGFDMPSWIVTHNES